MSKINLDYKIDINLGIKTRVELSARFLLNKEDIDFLNKMDKDDKIYLNGKYYTVRFPFSFPYNPRLEEQLVNLTLIQLD